MSNRISFDLPADDLQAIQAAMQTLQAKLQPHLVALDAASRRELPKMGAKTVDFVSKTLVYARAHTPYMPTFVDLDEYERDLEAVDTLRELTEPMVRLVSLLEDSLLLSGSEAYASALACYQAFKSAAKASQPDAERIADDLAERFLKRAAKGADHTPPSNGGQTASEHLA